MTYDPIDASASDDTGDSSATIDEIDATVLQGLNLDEARAGALVSIDEENGNCRSLSSRVQVQVVCESPFRELLEIWRNRMFKISMRLCSKFTRIRIRSIGGGFDIEMGESLQIGVQLSPSGNIVVC